MWHICSVKPIAVIVAFVACICSTSAQLLSPTIDVVTGLVEQWTDTTFGSPANTSVSDTLLLDVEPHPDADWVRSIIASRITTRHSRAVRSVGSEDRKRNVPKYLVTIVDLSTRYQNVEDGDSLLRVVTADLQLRVIDSDAAFQHAAPLRNETRCTREQAESLEDNQHNATHGSIPIKPHSFWDDVLQPVVFIAAAAITVVLLFTVRSQ